MIFGKTSEQKRLKETNKERAYADKAVRGFIKFAWLPVKLTDTRIIFLEHYVHRYRYQNDSAYMIYANRKTEAFWRKDPIVKGE